MKIALVSEGTYPYALGGVSTWCDQLIRGFPEHQWEMVAITVDGSERPSWPAPDNLENVTSIPLFAPPRPRRWWKRAAAPPAGGFASAYDSFLVAMLTPHDPRSNQAMVARSRFLFALRGIFEYVQRGGDLRAAMTSNGALAQMGSVWRRVRFTELPLADAIEAAELFEHMLRPLSQPPVKCDVVHTSMNGLSMLVAMAAKWRYGTPVVMSEHGIYLRERYLGYLDENAPYAVRALMLSFFRALAGAGYLIADALAPHSSYNRRWQLQNGGDPDRMWTMYNGVELADFPVAEDEPERPTIAFMGRIDPLKDLHTMIRAFAHVRTRVPGARLRIFGGTPSGNERYAQSCRQLIDDLGLADSAALEGSVPSPVHAYHAASVVALTSVSEGFPVTVIEAMACGRPMVCTNVGGVAEAVVDAGFVVAPRDHYAVAEACVTLLLDDELRHRMGQAARERVLRSFTLGESLASYRRVYDHLIEVPSPEQIVERRPRTPHSAGRRHRGHAAGTARAMGRVRVRAGEDR